MSKGCQKEWDAFKCGDEFGYQSNVANFHWWNSAEKISNRHRDGLPISALPNLYPYRYTSAGPCTVGRTQKEWDMYRCFLDTKPKVKRTEKLDLKDIVQIDGYETSSMTASLVPFRAKRNVTDFTSNKIAPGLNEPLFVPFKAHSEFEQYVIDTLYPGWKNDPLYKRRVIFRMDFFKPPLK